MKHQEKAAVTPRHSPESGGCVMLRVEHMESDVRIESSLWNRYEPTNFPVPDMKCGLCCMSVVLCVCCVTSCSLNYQLQSEINLTSRNEPNTKNL